MPARPFGICKSADAAPGAYRGASVPAGGYSRSSRAWTCTGGEGRLSHSVDGTVPYPAQAERAAGFTDVAYGNGVFVAVGWQGTLYL